MGKTAAGVLFTAALVVCSGCSDSYLVKKASAAYVIAEARYEEECVKVKCPDAAARQQGLKTDREFLNTSITAAKVGKLPKSARQRLKEIAAR